MRTHNFTTGGILEDKHLEALHFLAPKGSETHMAKTLAECRETTFLGRKVRTVWRHTQHLIGIHCSPHGRKAGGAALLVGGSCVKCRIRLQI